MVRYGKFIVGVPDRENLDNIAIVDTGGTALDTCQAVVLQAQDNNFSIYRALELATEPFHKVYIQGDNALEFLIYCIMAKLYRHYDPRSKYIVRDVVRVISEQVAQDTLINLAKLVKLELQLKISML